MVPRQTSEPTQGAPGIKTGNRSRLGGVVLRAQDLVSDPRIATVLLAACAAAMFGILLYVGRWLTFWLDEWDFIFDRQAFTLRALFAPVTDTLLVNLVLVYQAFLNAFGLGTYWPFLLATWIGHMVCVALLYRTVSRRSGATLGLMSGLSLLFLGSAFEVLLQPFQMQYIFSAVGGLLALERLAAVEHVEAATRRKRDLAIAAIALVMAIAWSSAGPLFVGLIVVWAVLRRDWRAFAATVPATVAYAAWYFTWGQESVRVHGTPLGPIELLAALVYGVGAAVSGLVGLPPARFALVGILIAAVAGAAVIARRRATNPLAIASILALVAEYALQAVFRGAFGVEHGARSGYIYPAVIFLWLAVSGVIGNGLRPDRWRGRTRFAWVPLLAGLLIVPMASANMWQFFGASGASRGPRATELAELRLIEALRNQPNLLLDESPDLTLLAQLTAGEYLTAIDRFGRPTLGFEWERWVDTDSVNAAALRLLGGAIALDVLPGSVAAAPVMEVSSATTSLGMEPGCQRIEPRSSGVVARWPADHQVIWLKGISAGGTSLRLSVIGPPSAAVDGAIWQAVLAGRRISLPDLPSGYRWLAELRTDAATPFEICTTRRV